MQAIFTLTQRGAGVSVYTVTMQIVVVHCHRGTTNRSLPTATASPIRLAYFLNVFKKYRLREVGEEVRVDVGVGVRVGPVEFKLPVYGT